MYEFDKAKFLMENVDGEAALVTSLMAVTAAR